MQIKIITQNRDAIVDATYKDIRRRNGEIYVIEGNKLESISSVGKYDEQEAIDIFEYMMKRIDEAKTEKYVFSMPERNAVKNGSTQNK